MNDNFDTDHDLVDHLIDYKSGFSEESQAVMAQIRRQFSYIGHYVVNNVPRTPDRTVALRAIHQACQASITALALNAPEVQ